MFVKMFFKTNKQTLRRSLENVLNVAPVEGIENVPYLTNETIFDLKELPGSMIIIGGGPIGSEMASALNRLGVKIAQVKMADIILSREDKELAGILMKRLKDNGVNILTNTRATKFSENEKKLTVTIQNKSRETTQIEADSGLISVGRKPNVNGLDLEKAGVDFTPKGIEVNEKLQTTANNIYACGDVIDSYQFSHIAEYHSRIAVPNAVLPCRLKER
jgi:pyruvate/2-oxoglutarate dehydrogenase complex dihydrolipoamide dehydrogenase (E3) component